MSIIQRIRQMPPRAAGGVLAASLALGAAGILGPALATSAAPAMQMTSMATTLSTSGNRVGSTPGWYYGRTVTFTYTRNFFCKRPPANHSSTGCEAGTDYEAIPATQFDPLYVIVPIGFTPARSTLACPIAGSCIDHPSTIDLSGVFNSSTYDNVKLPAHSHIITTLNQGKAEWWNVVVIGVTSPTTWNQIVAAKSYSEIMRLRNHGSTSVTGNIVTNVFLYFKVS
jgi:hypothetical protein